MPILWLIRRVFIISTASTSGLLQIIQRVRDLRIAPETPSLSARPKAAQPPEPGALVGLPHGGEVFIIDTNGMWQRLMPLADALGF